MLKTVLSCLLLLNAGCNASPSSANALGGRSATPLDVAEPPRPPPNAPATAGAATTGSSGSGDADVIYTCPMHPKVTSNAPGRCPECGMNLVPKKP